VTEPRDDAVAVVDPVTQLAALQAEVQQLEKTCEKYQTTLHALHARRHEGTLDRDGYINYLMAEDQLKVAFRKLEALRPQLLYAEAQAAVTAGVQYHDAQCAAVTEAGLVLCKSLVTFIESCAAFAGLVDAQISQLWNMRSATGPPAFEMPDGLLTLQALLAALPRGQELVQAVVHYIHQPLTVGDSTQAVASLARTQPFPPYAVERFLEGFRHVRPDL
jgi:hypothetical protein